MGELTAKFPEDDLGLFTAQLAAALMLFDSAAVPSGLASMEQLLQRSTDPAATGEARTHAAWLLALLDARGLPIPRPAPSRTPTQLRSPYTEMIAAARAASAGRWPEALALTQRVAVDSATQASDVVLRTVVKMLRAEWLERTGNVSAARRELRWADNYATGLGGAPQSVEVDWAFRTLARWKRARLLDRTGDRGPEVCACYTTVAHNWADGTAPYVARADTARARLRALDCDSRR